MKSTEQLAAFRKSLLRLKEALDVDKTPMTRDSAILRFELLFETAWKASQTIVRAQGLEANSPKQAFQAAFQLGWITNEQIWSEIIEKRNLAVHVYHEILAESLYERLTDFVCAFGELERSLTKAAEVDPASLN